MRAFSLALLLLVALQTVAWADDYGPRRDVRAVRAAVPVLIAARARALSVAEQVRVSDVVVVGDEAVALWNAGIQSGIVGLRRRYDSWWVSGQVDRDASETTELYWFVDLPGALPTCRDSGGFAAAPDALPVELNLSPSTISIAATQIAIIAEDGAREAAWRKLHPTLIVPYGIQRDCFTVRTKPSFEDYSGGYRANLTWTTPASLDIARFTGRAPTLAEFSGQAPGADAFYFFSVAFGGTGARVTGATLDVWFPFVLDPQLRYALGIAGTGITTAPLTGILRDNVLHFALPPITLPPNGELMGEIDGE